MNFMTLPSICLADGHDQACIAPCLRPCIVPWQSLKHCENHVCAGYRGSLELATLCFKACRVMESVTQFPLSRNDSQKYILPKVVNNETLINWILAPVNCKPFKGQRKYIVPPLRNFTAGGHPIVIDSEYKDEVCSCPLESWNDKMHSMSYYKIKSATKEIIYNKQNNTFVVNITWKPPEDYFGNFEIKFTLDVLVDIANPKNTSRTICYVTDKTEISFVLDHIANLSYAATIDKNYIPFKILKIPNTAGSFVMENIIMNNLVMEKFKEKYIPKTYSNLPIWTWGLIFAIILSTAVIVLKILKHKYRQRAHPVTDEDMICKKYYAFIIYQLSEHEVNEQLLQLLNENNIGYTTTAELYNAITIPLHEMVMNQFSTCRKVILYVTPDFVQIISKHLENLNSDDGDNDDSQTKFAKCTWSFLLLKRYERPVGNDIILVTDSRQYEGKLITRASQLLCLPLVPIYDLRYEAQCMQLVENLKTTVTEETRNPQNRV
ncbi:uncharacterized protein TRIADDRAFT_61636 [Trichoplax adhaerens]|uniref:SEFIR domain-containing protein n=1 Tax=Trichoplax adhaerens TaxID=10228 RepID=B3SBJ3_TRIAD|nr:predicted protein [Trichoplax adhaerens]EDV19864.1 predicted protein [Trichoplax adhaerens]|eukprot:XP_002117606.1 predicted protein [Trichoplax adhaerens]